MPKTANSSNNSKLLLTKPAIFFYISNMKNFLNHNNFMFHGAYQI